MSDPIACIVDGRMLWKCTSHGCPHVATREVYWPGRTLKNCNACFARIRQLASVFACVLASKELDVPSIGDDATVRFSLMELE